MTKDVSIRRAEDVFTVNSVIVTDQPGPMVRLSIDSPEHSTDMTMSPVTAVWLARELWKASGLPFDHNLRFRRRPS